MIRYVWDVECSPAEVIGEYVATVEDTVEYWRPDGTVGYAPVDCVEVRNDPYGAQKPHRPEHDPWMLDPGDVDYLAPADRWCRRCAKLDSDPIHV